MVKRWRREWWTATMAAALGGGVGAVVDGG
jgi:hypothetical protein